MPGGINCYVRPKDSMVSYGFDPFAALASDNDHFLDRFLLHHDLPTLRLDYHVN